MSTYQDALATLLRHEDLSAENMHACVGGIMDGEWSNAEISALLTALKMKGEVVSEVVGAARAMQERAVFVATERTDLLDTCGTGGDQLHTFNISTATALVAAALEIPVAKHGNRSVSSSSGSADVLEKLGVRVDVTTETVSSCLNEIGIGFCFAPLMHGAMKHVAPVRRELGFPTIFNLLGPLTNPARAEYQLLGVSRNETAHLLATAMSQMGRKRVVVVCGNDQLDEVSLWGSTLALEVVGEQITQHEWTADSFGLGECTPDDLHVNSSAESAAVIREILAGKTGPHRDIVVANSAAALTTIGRTDSPLEAAEQAATAIDTGKAAAILERLAEMTNAG